MLQLDRNNRNGLDLLLYLTIKKEPIYIFIIILMVTATIIVLVVIVTIIVTGMATNNVVMLKFIMPIIFSYTLLKPHARI